MAQPLPLEEKKRRRALFMKRLYERTDGRLVEFLDYHELGGEFGWAADETEAVAEYLEKEGLIKFPVMGPIAAITHAGVVEVEQSLENPDKPTQHFPPLSVVIVQGDVHQSQIQAGSPGATQEQAFDIQNHRELIETFVREMRNRLAEMERDSQERQAIEADIVTVETQLESPNPRGAVVREALRSLRNVAEGAAASGAFVGLVELARRLPI